MDSLQREFDAAWAQFQTLDFLRLVPETLESEWTRGRDTYLALLIPVGDREVVSHLRGLVRRIEHVRGLEPYPESYWHITVKGVGFETQATTQPGEVGLGDFEQIAETARRVFAAQHAFEVTIGSASGFPEVVFAEVSNSLPVRELNTRLLEALPGLVRYPFDGESFLPHVSIARFTSDAGIDELRETLSTLRREGPGPSFLVREIHLVRAHLSAAAPKLETIERYGLRPS